MPDQRYKHRRRARREAAQAIVRAMEHPLPSGPAREAIVKLTEFLYAAYKDDQFDQDRKAYGLPLPNPDDPRWVDRLFPYPQPSLFEALPAK